jgi:hypothetical protein
MATVPGNDPIDDLAGAFGSRYRGTKNALATRVGTTALPITVAIRCEYCAWSMMWCVSPNASDGSKLDT